jgi:hypothetical protein
MRDVCTLVLAGASPQWCSTNVTLLQQQVVHQSLKDSACAQHACQGMYAQSMQSTCSAFPVCKTVEAVAEQNDLQGS